MKNSTKIALGIIVVLIAIFAFYKLKNNEPSTLYDDFARCLTEKNVTMYGAYWCSHCQNQKKMFGDSWQYVNYVECDPQGDNARPELCEQKGVEGYPTWEFPNNELISGELTFREMAFRSNCTLPNAPS